MAIVDSLITDRFAVYNGDCCEVLPSIPSESIHMSVYSPPFGGIYQYSSSPSDISNCKDYDEFLEHYGFVVSEIGRVTMKGRLTCVHCMDTPRGGDEGLIDLPGDIIRLHESAGFVLHARYHVWKEPLRVAIRTRSKGLTHRQLVQDSTLSGVATSDQVLVMRKRGSNPVPVSHPTGLATTYAGMQENLPEELVAKYSSWKEPKTNKLSQWIWQQYASPFWDDVRIDRVLPYKAARETDEEKHIHPLQLDVIERCVTMWSNHGERILTPFAGVGSEVYVPVCMGRFGLGVELKGSYYRQMIRNLQAISDKAEQPTLMETQPDEDRELAEAMA